MRLSTRPPTYVPPRRSPSRRSHERAGPSQARIAPPPGESAQRQGGSMSAPRHASPLARHVAAARKPVKAAEQLADEILGFIVEGGLLPGTRLAPERQMLADTGRARR